MKVGDVLARYKPASKFVRILLDGSIQSEIDDVRARIKRTKRAEAANDPGLRSQLPDFEEELAKLEARAVEASVVFKLSAIPGKEFDRLKFENPPTEADWKRYRDTQEANPQIALLGRIGAPEFNTDEFLPRLVGLSVSEVDGEDADWTEDDGLELWETLHDGARATLAEAAWEVNGEKSARPLSETATGMTSNSGSGSTTAASKESPTPSS